MNFSNNTVTYRVQLPLDGGGLGDDGKWPILQLKLGGDENAVRVAACDSEVPINVVGPSQVDHVYSDLFVFPGIGAGYFNLELTNPRYGVNPQGAVTMILTQNNGGPRFQVTAIDQNGTRWVFA